MVKPDCEEMDRGFEKTPTVNCARMITTCRLRDGCKARKIIDVFPKMNPTHWNRRFFLRASGLAIASPFAASSTPAAEATATASATTQPPSIFRNPSVYRFHIGDIEAFSISDGSAMIGNQDMRMMYPENERQAMSEVMTQHSETANGIPLYVNILVLRKDREVAIFDAGFGSGTNAKWGWLFAALANIGIQREDVTVAFLSHGHVDHIAGFIKDDKPAFPNAELVVMQEEIAFWQGPNPDFSLSKRDQRELPGLIRDNCHRFDVLKAQTRAVRHGATAWQDRIRVEHAPGHTAGHAVFHIESQGEKLLHMMDIAHHHLLMFAQVHWTIAFDHDPVTAVQTRRRIYAQAALSKTRVYGFHLPWPGIGRILELSPQQYAWHPERYAWD